MAFPQLQLHRQPRRRLLAVIVVVFVVTGGLLFHARYLYSSSKDKLVFPAAKPRPTAPPGSEFPELPRLIEQLWRPLLHDIDEPVFVSDEGYRYTVNESSRHWTKPLGKKVLILDVDTRLNQSNGSLLNVTAPKHNKISRSMGGALNHYMYAMIHGYDYRLVRAADYPNRHGTWVKVPMIKEALKTHDIVVFLDFDAVFMYPHMPMEWLMNMWNISNQTLIALAKEPVGKSNQDAKGVLLQNTGFIIAQQSERTQQLFQDWDDCPKGRKHPDCKRWATDWAHEQAAFGNHIRYDYNGTDEVRAIPCMDGNGAPYIGDKKCGGVFVRHHWFRKDDVTKDLYAAVLDMFVRRMHMHFHDALGQYFLDAARLPYPIKELTI